MNADRWARVKEIFGEASELDVGDRADFVREKLPGDDASSVEIREEVLRLLAIEETGSAALDRPPMGADAALRFADVMFPAPALSAGQTLLDRYRVLRKVGAGGMGEVYEAEDLALGERVALKQILPAFAMHPAAVSRFRREVQLARKVTHPNVCRVFDLVQLPAQPPAPAVDMIAMEFLDGETLAERLCRQPAVTHAESMEILQQLIAGLAAAHRAGIVHRDLKSANVFLTRNAGALRVAITDFGLARPAPGDPLLTAGTTAGGTGAGIGTPAYMAPEQLEGGKVGPAADQYALGVIMFEMATGSRPHASPSPLQIAARRMKEKPEQPRALNPAVNQGWEAVILRCLEYDPVNRFPDVEAVGKALGSSRPAWLPVWRPKRARLLAATAGLAVLAVGVAIGDRWRTPEPLPAEVARWHREGMAAAASGSWMRARQSFEAAVEAMPQFAEGRARLADALGELDLYDDARAEILRATDTPKRSRAEELLVAGMRGVILRDLPKACGFFEQRLGRLDASAKPDGLMDLARCQDRAFLPRETESSLNAVLASDRTHPSALAMLASLRDRDGKAEESLALLDRASATYDRTGNREGLAEIAIQKAFQLEENSRFGEALEAAKAARDAAEALGNQHLLLRSQFRVAGLLVREGRAEEGLALARAAVEAAGDARLETTIAAGQIDMASALQSQALYEQALVAAEEGLARAQRAGAPRLRALGLQRKAELAVSAKKAKPADVLPLLAEAEAFFRESGMKRDGVRVLFSRATILRREDRAASEATYRTVAEESARLGMKRQESAAWRGLGSSMQNRGDYPGALEVFQKALAAAKAGGGARSEMLAAVQVARAQDRLGDVSGAIAILKGLMADPRLADESVRTGVGYQLGGALITALEFEEAERVLAEQEKRATERASKDDLAIVHLLQCHAAGQAGWVEKARARCAPLVAPLTRDQEFSNLSDVHGALAVAELAAGRHDVAAAQAALARQAGEKGSKAIDRFYPILFQAAIEQARGNSARYLGAAEEARSVFAEIEGDWGKDAASRYLRRPLTEKFWKIVAAAGQ